MPPALAHSVWQIYSATMHPNISEQAPGAEAAISPYKAARPLRLYLGRHNRQALLLAFFSLVAATVLWAAVYAFVYWCVLFTVTIVKSFDPETMSQVTDPNLVDPNFPLWFAGGSVIYLLVAASIRRFFRVERVREARLYLLWVLLELFMAIPNVTFSIWGNLQAITSLRRHESSEAWRLLQRMNHEQGRVSLTSLRLVIEDEKTLNKILFALQIIGLVSVRENTRGWFLYLQGQDVRKLLARGTA